MKNEFQSFLDKQGRNLRDQPIYRLVWSDAQHELRLGTYDDFCGPLYLRTVREVRLVPKYSYIHERWIVEKWFGPELAFSSELPDSVNGSYEPLYVFETEEGRPLPVTLKALEFIVSCAERPPRRRLILTEQEAKEKEIKQIEEEIDITDIQSLLHSREAVGYRGK